jgi:flagellar biosynthesis protein FlhG
VGLTNLKSTVRGTSNSNSIIVAVGGGKGGVGKSFISSNLAIFLANMGFNTVIIDLDLGAPNMHTSLGEPAPTKNFHDFLNGKIDSITDAAVATHFPKLRLITGANNHEDLANISPLEQSRLMSAINKIQADFVILDLSAGTHTSTLDFFLMANRHIVALTPDPTSIENAYRFMRASFFRRIKRFEHQLNLGDTVNQLMTSTNEHKIHTPSDLLIQIQKLAPDRGAELKGFLGQMQFDIVLNQTRGAKDVQLGQSISSVCRKYFGIPVQLLGHVDYDNAVWNALRKRRPVVLDFPNSALYSQILGLARDLASPHLKKAVV